MRTGLGASAFAAILAFTAASSAGAAEREMRPLEGFDEVEVSGGIDLDLSVGATFAVEVATDGDLEDVVTELRGNTLVIRRKGSVGGFFNWGDDDADVRITLPALKALTASGGSDVRTEGTFASDKLTLVASGGSDVTIDVDADTLEATASGGSDLRLLGRARAAAVRSSGGSDVDASQLTADEATVRSSGGSDVSLSVREKIAANASGGSDITYSGGPQTVDINATGGSDVRSR